MRLSIKLRQCPDRKFVLYGDAVLPVCLLVLVIASLVTTLSGCTDIPGYARPQISSAEEYVTENYIRYRVLSRADFQASEPPQKPGGQHYRLNAHTALRMQLDESSRIVVHERGGEGTHKGKYLVQALDVRFEALMIPSKSWWNPVVPQSRFSYVLQHEQIHFALMELKVRELNQVLERDRTDFTVETTDPESVKQKMKERISELMRQANDELLEEHTAFDKATSARFDHMVQNWWYKRISERLSRTRSS